jgi:hypothetical protein
MSTLLDPGSLLDAAEAVVVESRQAEFTRLRIAGEWARANRPDPEQLQRNPLCARQVGASQLLVTQCVEGELAACLQIHPLAALRLMGHAVDIEARLPAVWTALAELRLEVWVARKAADLTALLTVEQARSVDAQVVDKLGIVPPGRLLKIVEARVVEADQELADRLAAERAKARGVWAGQQDGDGNTTIFARAESAGMRRFLGMVDHVAHLLREHCPELVAETMDQLRGRALVMLGNPLAILKLLVGADEHDVPDVVAAAIRAASPRMTRPRTIAYVHFTPETLEGLGIARAEELGALTRQRLVDLLGHEHVTLKPVIDLNGEVAADCYEIPPAVSEQLHLTRPADCFPFAESVSRKQDQDHTKPYRPHGPPGQTRLSNLGHLVRRHHRIKTFGGWKVWQRDGRFTWISPHGRIYLTDARGTHCLTADVGGFTEAIRYVQAA